MASIVPVTPSANPLEVEFSVEVTLNGVTYQLDFYWQEFNSGWYVSIPGLIAGRRVSADTLLFDGKLDAPEIVAVDTSGEARDPTQFDLGERVVLVAL